MKKYHYTECGLSNIYLINGFEALEFEGEKAFSVHDTEGLHKAIGENLLLKTTLLSGEEIRFLRKELGLSQRELAGIFGVADQSVANYEKEIHKQNQAVDIILRLKYAFKISFGANINDFLCRLALDEIERLEVEFQEDHGHWSSTQAA